MRWPLRYQIMAPMAAVLALTVAGSALVNAYYASERARDHVVAQLRNIARTLAHSTFPLTNPVLEQMRGLSGAQFLVVDTDQRHMASTTSDWPQRFELGRPSEADALQLGGSVKLAGVPHLHASVVMPGRDQGRGPPVLHIAYPGSDLRRLRWEAAGPPLLVGAISLALVAGLAAWIAARVTRPLSRLRRQVERIAGGDFAPLDPPARDDEVRELASAVNQMAGRLATYETQIRRTEQLRTLGQLGAALAHQLRNSATGARMAVDLHRGDCPRGDDESLEVATQQLVLMEKYLRKFLALGGAPRSSQAPVELRQLILSLIPLVRPAAAHADVELTCELGERPLVVQGEEDALEQLVLNLLINALEAATEQRVGDSTTAAMADGSAGAAESTAAPTSRRLSQVVVRLTTQGQRIQLSVEDTGAGPDPAIAASLFEPFTTAKRDGVGLGLSVARQVAEQHEGTIRWERLDDRTRFVVELPLAVQGVAGVEAAGR